MFVEFQSHSSYLSRGGGDILPSGGGRGSMKGGRPAPNNGGTIMPIGGNSPPAPPSGRPTNDGPAAVTAPGRPGSGGSGRLLVASATEEKEASTRLPGPEGGRSRLEKPFTEIRRKVVSGGPLKQ